jgi:hypothetical protein
MALGIAFAASACGSNPASSGGVDASADASPEADTAVDPAPVVANCAAPAGAFVPLATRCGHFVDAQGRVRVLRGVNARVLGVFDADLGAGHDPRIVTFPLPAADLVRMRRIGFDVLRLPLDWSALEPNDTSPPTYDSSYLDRVAQVVADAKAADVQVLLDFHQDAFSKWIGQDGAPLWAISPAPASIDYGPLDLGTASLSSVVQNAFATLISATSTDAVALRGRYAAAIAAVAKRFAGDTTVIGIELMNEPQATDDQLRAFHATLVPTVRQADPARLLFFEPPATRNLIDSAEVPTQPLSDATGKPFDGVVYAPHVYTQVFNPGDKTSFINSFTLDDLLPSNQNAREEAQGWQAPLFIGEYGWGPTGDRFPDYIGDQLIAQDMVMASSTWWTWKEAPPGGSWGMFDYDAATATWTERTEVRQTFARVQPRAIAGWPTQWSYDKTAQRFDLVMQTDASVHGPTVLHVPTPEDGPTGWQVSCDGHPVVASPDVHGDVSVDCAGVGRHEIIVSPTR